MKQKTTGAKKGPKKSPQILTKEILVELGETFRKARQNQGLTFEEVSKASGVSTLYISNLEKGKYDNIGLGVLYSLSQALGLELNVEVE